MQKFLFHWGNFIKMEKLKKTKVSVIGLGFVGLSLSVVNANYGFQTIGIDIDKEKIEKLKKGIPDFFEPQLDKILKDSLKKKTLSFSEDLNDILQSDITFITVGTPSTPKGKIDLKNLKNVIKKLSKILNHKKKKHLIVIKSTIIPTTTIDTIIPYFDKNSNVKIVMNPEFLREGNAINGLIKPHLIVIGCNEKNGCNELSNYYKKFYKKLPEILETDLTTAEMIKYTNNVFLATKISFINTIANICQNIPNVDVNKIAYGIGRDSRIGSEFLHAGPGFGGSCLPKDLSALIDFSNKFGNANNLLKAVEDVNKIQPTRIIKMMEELGIKNKQNISILGLSFKRDTDDIREAISNKVVNLLLKRGMKINVHDPMALDNFKRKYGTKINYFNSVNQCLKNTHCCIILTDWSEYKKLKENTFLKYMKKNNLIDAKRILNPQKFSKMNYRGVGLGKRK